MNCPSCGTGMEALALGGRLGTEVPIDLCRTCHLIWFDKLESVKLAPGGTLKLFRLIGEHRQKPPAPVTDMMKCPRCDIRLLLTHDRTRSSRFRYWRCARDHGRLITFFDFLREKDFIKPISPQQLAELRENVQTIHCSNCGAPIDLARDSACAHCASPLSTIDVKEIERVANELRDADEASRTIDPALAVNLALEKMKVETLFRSLREDNDWNASSPLGLVEAGLWFVSRKLS